MPSPLTRALCLPVSANLEHYENINGTNNNNNTALRFRSLGRRLVLQRKACPSELALMAVCIPLFIARYSPCTCHVEHYRRYIR